MPAPVEIITPNTAAEWAEARQLVLDLAAWVYGELGVDMFVSQLGFADEMADMAAVYDPPRGVFLLARHAGVAVGTLALKQSSPGVGELKRMYVRPGGRRTGAGHGLIQSALAVAAELAITTLWLETAPGPMDPAIRMYERFGFRGISTESRTVASDGVLVMERRTATAA